ncbi:hypothetical protein NE237_002774 [Protea cynaroides]|uniref:S-protein homolog n=1 Tax=Protea cynaroides TaxID=273540 RepID=A0A9Q0QRZ2_9MAGN|nr:hypothetical protein NE237_002774 [Protea cynaroides]
MSVRILNSMDQFQWQFRDELWGKTQFSCNLSYTWRKEQRRGNFMVYDTDNENLRMHPCFGVCEWLVKANGLFALDTDVQIWDFELPWSGWDDEDPGAAWVSVLKT